MPKESGLAWTTCSVDDTIDGTETLRAIINDVTNLDFSTPRGVQDISGVDKSALERLLLLADFTLSLSGVFNDAVTTGQHNVLKTITNTSEPRTVTLAVSGQTLTNEVLFENYEISRSSSGELTYTAAGSLSSGTVPAWS